MTAAVIALVISSDDLHAWLTGFLPTAEAIVRGQPVLGVVVFILFAALSAMLAFVSSALIVPVGVYVWGKAASMFLLWIGWIFGGLCAYSISRYLGRPTVKALCSRSAFESYENRISNRASFSLVLLFQIAMPSEVPGYLLGLARYHFWKYLVALALAELPYAVATVYLGSSFIERQVYLLAGVGVAVAGLSGWALYVLHRRVITKRT
ncbi:MAG: VTT domain-containing protein [Acidobacteria bacterium]|nr:VTT domain-containing protein [Acidobacteriota bacterium]